MQLCFLLIVEYIFRLCHTQPLQQPANKDWHHSGRDRSHRNRVGSKKCSNFHFQDNPPVFLHQVNWKYLNLQCYIFRSISFNIFWFAMLYFSFDIFDLIFSGSTMSSSLKQWLRARMKPRTEETEITSTNLYFLLIYQINIKKSCICFPPCDFSNFDGFKGCF